MLTPNGVAAQRDLIILLKISAIKLSFGIWIVFLTII